MAKRSDFAQKLLDDLRLRKERMTATATATASHSHSSNQSHHLPIDAYAYTKQTYRGSRNTKANEIVSSGSGEMLNRSSRRQRSVKSGELSNQIIPYGKAFENGGKLRRADLSFTNSILGFLQKIQRGTMDRGSNLDRQLASTSHTLSLVQINEISKGAQKLNHILRACCSNGVNMDTYSLNFAKELLQGAIDLEESLGMLVELQKSSEFMITSQTQNKNRITLLEEEEEEDDEEDKRRMEKMQLVRPTFLFDNKMLRTITITNSKEAKKIKVSQQKGIPTNNSEAVADISNQMGDKGRIPNVIAKLMGLDNLPEKKDSGNSNTASSKHSSSTTLKSKQTDNLIKNQKVVVGSFKNLMFGGADKNLVLQNQKTISESEVVGIKSLKGFDKASIINGSAQKNFVRESQNYVEVVMGRKQDRPNNSGTFKGRTTSNGNDPVRNLHERRSQVKSANQVANASIIQPEKRHAITNKHMQMGNENKSRDHLGVQKSNSYYILSKGRGREMTIENSSKQSTNNPQKKKKKKQSSINQPTPFKKSCGNHDLVESNEKVNEIINRKSSPRYEDFERRQTVLKDHKLASSKKIKPEQMLRGRNGQGKFQEASDRASGGKFKVFNGAERKRASMFIEAEQLLPTTLYNSGNGGDLQESPNDLQYEAVPGSPHEGLKTSEVALHKIKTNGGIQEYGMGVKLEDQNICEKQPLLTESGNRLKLILVMSQLFVNTAEALFRLNIPFGILQGGRQDQGSKLILDCGYEVMKRKGIRQELKVHTCSKISSITSTANIIRSLDDLVRQLSEDMDKLKLYGRKNSSQVDVEEMIQRDVYHKYPDIDCMWDLGWNDDTLAFIEKYDVIRDIEKHIISVLLDEITKDYCMFKEN